MASNKTADKLVSQAQSWIGCNEKDGSFKKIINKYNSYEPLPRGYKVQYTDAWCATFVSACAIATKMTDIIPPECSCEYMIKQFKELGCWQEDESIVPKKGYIIFYDWDDTGKGNDTGVADHVGIVEKVANKKKITVIEGNYQDSVKRRTIDVNGIYIRGYAIPDYDTAKKTTKTETKGTETKKTETKKTETKKAETKSVSKDDVEYAAFKDDLTGGGKTFKTTTFVNFRSGAGMDKPIIKTLATNTSVTWFGYYNVVNKVKWYLVVDPAGDRGYMCSKYLK